MYKVSSYILERLSEVGVRDFFASNDNLELSKEIKNNNDLNLINFEDKSNSIYAANAYAKIYGISVLISNHEFEQSNSIDAIFDTYLQNTPTINIIEVEYSKISNFKSNLLNNKNLIILDKIYKLFLDSIVWLDYQNFSEEFDLAIKKVVFEKKPICIFIPKNLFNLEIRKPEKELSFKLFYDKKNLDIILYNLKQKIDNANSIVILCGNLISRNNLKNFVEVLSNKINANVLTSLESKSCFNNSSDLYFGSYSDIKVSDKINDLIVQSDLILDFTDEFLDNDKIIFNKFKIIKFSQNQILYDNKTFDHLPFGVILSRLLKMEFNNKKEFNSKNNNNIIPFLCKNNHEITFSRFLNAIENLLNKNDVLVYDTNILDFNILDFNISNNSEFITTTNTLSSAIGAKVSNLNNKIIALSYDYMFYKSIIEFKTALCNNLNIVCFSIKTNKLSFKNFNCLNIELDKLIKSIDINNQVITLKVFNENDLYSAISTILTNNSKFIFIEVNLSF